MVNERLGRYQDAIAAFESYLERAGDAAPDKDDIEQRIGGAREWRKPITVVKVSLTLSDGGRLAAHTTAKEIVMADPVIADKQPVLLELEPGKYFWCSCGRSQNQPFCDGAHQGTDFTPVEFTVETKKKHALCLCKHTAKPPMCDGAHRKL